MQFLRTQNSGIRLIKLPIARIFGLIIVLQIGVSCTPARAVKSASMETNIFTVTDQLRTINDAVTRHYLTSDNGPELLSLVKEGHLAFVPQPPLGLGSEYTSGWKTDPTGINTKMNVEYIQLLEVPDDFCKAWNNVKHPELGKVIMPDCQDAAGQYTCAVKKLSVDVRKHSPTDQCGQTCCVAGNVILYKNGYAEKKN